MVVGRGAMIVLFTDFGADDVYVGQMKAALLAHAPHAVIVDLLHSAPAFRIEASAHLLAALQRSFAVDSVFVAVVDPGVGGGRDACIVHGDGKWYVGPDNGLLSVVAARSARVRTWRIAWNPPTLSASFHGRDLFAPIAASIACGDVPADKLESTAGLHVRLAADDLNGVVYIDHYGNAMTGVRASRVRRNATIRVHDSTLPHAHVFSAVPEGATFWYENSVGLVEIAANRASAARLLDIRVGDAIEVID